MTKLALASVLAVAAGAAAQANHAIEGWSYIGCVEADPSTFGTPINFFAPFTPEECEKSCAGKAKFAAVGGGCFCETPDEEPPVAKTGAKSQKSASGSGDEKDADAPSGKKKADEDELPGQGGSRGPPDGSRGPPDGSRGPPDGSRGPPDGSRGPPDGSRGPPDGSRGPPDGSRGPPDGSRGPPDGSRGPPDGVRGPPEGLKPLPGAGAEGVPHPPGRKLRARADPAPEEKGLPVPPPPGGPPAPAGTRVPGPPGQRGGPYGLPGPNDPPEKHIEFTIVDEERCSNLCIPGDKTKGFCGGPAAPGKGKAASGKLLVNLYKRGLRPVECRKDVPCPLDVAKEPTKDSAKEPGEKNAKEPAEKHVKEPAEPDCPEAEEEEKKKAPVKEKVAEPVSPPEPPKEPVAPPPPPPAEHTPKPPPPPASTHEAVKQTTHAAPPTKAVQPVATGSHVVVSKSSRAQTYSAPMVLAACAVAVAAYMF